MTVRLQPFLNEETVVLRAPVQAWSAADGTMGGSPIHGIYAGDLRIVSAQNVLVGGHAPEHIATLPAGADSATFVGLDRLLDDPTPDPGVRVEHTRTATVSGVTETLSIRSRLPAPVTTEVRVDFRADATEMDDVKSGQQPVTVQARVTSGGAQWSTETTTVRFDAPGATVTKSSATWQVTVPARGSVEVTWTYSVDDPDAVVRGVTSAAPWSVPRLDGGDDRLSRWLDRALGDLDALRLTTPRAAGEQFLAAGAPWFFTLFGRDSLWAARFMLPLGTRIAASTLRVLATLQGAEEVADTAEQPGKIMHELRRSTLEIPGEGISLPPLYYGTVDATALWITLLHDAWRWGMPDDEVRTLLPHLERALAWMRDYGDSDGDSLLEYVDASGRGLSNQGWKDSGDSVQFRDGTLAEGPIALVEVQAYAYEAALGGAALLDAFGGDGTEWREWAQRLRTRFHETFWVEDERGAYLAIALDKHKRPVDSVTSNLGHVLGTGILSARQAALTADRLVDATMSSGYGLRTMSTDSGGYWPLSYHGGSVWTHDTAIAILGLAREGLAEHADTLTAGILAAAVGFDYRLPELHSGDAAAAASRPVPYPASCRPQAWSAAASVAVLSAGLGLRPDAPEGELGVSPSPRLGAVDVRGIVFAGTEGGISTNSDGEVIGSTLPIVVG